jgi:hypothetical protein
MHTSNDRKRDAGESGQPEKQSDFLRTAPQAPAAQDGKHGAEKSAPANSDTPGTSRR